MIEIKEKFQEFYQNIQDKARNPFLLTFVVVWIIHNWVLVYSIFTFDLDANQKSKVDFIKQYIIDHDGWYGMVFPSLWWTLGSMAIFYGFNIISDTLSTFYHVIKGFISKLINDKRRFKTIEEFDQVSNKSKRLQKRIEDLERLKQEISVAIADKEEECRSEKATNEELRNKIIGANSREMQIVTENNKILKVLEEKNENLQFELDKQENHVAKIALERKHIAKDKIKYDKLKDFALNIRPEFYDEYVFGDVYKSIIWHKGEALFSRPEDVTAVFKGNFNVYFEAQGVSEYWREINTRTFEITNDNNEDSLVYAELVTTTIEDGIYKLSFLVTDKEETSERNFKLIYSNHQFTGTDGYNSEVTISYDV